ncbi:uncharacterized protein EHS24_008991 [Apiotrichum porosum]|uniref:Signal peptidase complex subunit 1 n=1 Tax=Apiotrichum porosum TaxID=105984 RepID=A0A427XNR2_9TREE|nr:uncharacterized protein EHS24_008991 [Apiotrichum porosum]RSH80414.1 hypothetical protein EHS24_008991 [Apiotrichum porosum]
MEYLPQAVQTALKGDIDPYTQSFAEWAANIYLGVLVAIAFAISFFTSNVLLGLEVFLAGFVVLILAVVPPWPFLNSHAIKFLPVRSAPAAKS